MKQIKCELLNLTNLQKNLKVKKLEEIKKNNSLTGHFKNPEITSKMKEKLKTELFMNGTEAIIDFLGFYFVDDKDVIENHMDEVINQMPKKEFMKYYYKYCINRKDNLNGKIK